MGATPVEATHPVSGARRHSNALFILSKLGPRAFKSLYNSMPADQQKNADQVFMKYGSAPAKS